jgi:hypothetical protein
MIFTKLYYMYLRRFKSLKNSAILPFISFNMDEEQITLF